MKSLAAIGTGLVFAFAGLAVYGEATPDTNSPALTGESAAPLSSHSPTHSAAATTAPATTREQVAPSTHVATLAVADLREYEKQSPAVQRLVTHALALTTLNLSYKYGSADPAAGGMDCSGTVYHLLNESGVKDVPRDASEMYRWVWTQGTFRAVVSSNPGTFELAPLQPGDLLFWTGTYRVDRDPPVTHVMIYLGIDRHTGHRVMMGASEGRQYAGESRYGVSVFDFTLPGRRKTGAGTGDALQSRFIGYGAVPGLGAP